MSDEKVYDLAEKAYDHAANFEHGVRHTFELDGRCVIGCDGCETVKQRKRRWEELMHGVPPRVPARTESEEALIVCELMVPMLKKLAKNRDKKGHWAGEDIRFLLARVREEVDELAQSLDDGTADEVVFECADVANIAAMIAYKARRGQR